MMPLDLFRKGAVAVVRLEDRVCYGGATPTVQRGSIAVFGAAQELSFGNPCELRDGLMVKGWPSGPPGSGISDYPPIQGIVMYATDSRSKAEAWLAEYRATFA